MINMLSNKIKKMLLLLACCISLPALAGTGSLRVEVIDQTSQRPLSGVVVEVKARDNKKIDVTTNEKGIARQEALEPGLYEVFVSKQAFSSSRLPSIRIIDGKTTALVIQLLPADGALEEMLIIGTTQFGDELSSTVIDRESLRSASGSGSDVMRALDGLPGLFSSGDFASFTVRGNGPRDNLILVDGIPFDNVIHFEDSFGEQEDLEGGGRYSVFAPNIVSKAEFQPGGWNAAYGGKAGSLLKLEVASGNPETASHSVRADLSGLEYSYDGPSAIHEDTTMLFSARSLDFGRFFETIGIDDVGTPELTDVILKTRTEASDNHTAEFLMIFAPESFIRDVDNVLASYEDDIRNYEDVELIETDRDNSLFALTWTALLGEDAEWQNRIYFRNYDEETSTGEAIVDGVGPNASPSDLELRPNILQSERSEKEMGLRSDFSIGNSVGRFNAGLRIVSLDYDLKLQLNQNWNRYVYDANDFRPDPNQRYIILTPQAVNSTYLEKETNFAAYVDQEFQFDYWDLRLGLRGERDGFSDESLIAPRFGLNWQVNDALEFSSTLGRYHQAPSINDRARDAGNAALENEIIDQFSFGLKYYFNSDLELFIEPYYQQLENLVVEEDEVNQVLTNQGSGESFGFDTAITRRFADGWSANFTYSYSDAQVKDSDNEEFYDSEFSRPHSISFGGIWEINSRWKVSGRWKWASGATRDEYVVHENVLGVGQPVRYSKEIIMNNVDRYDSYSSFNVRADYRRSLGTLDFVAFIDVINLFGSDNTSNSKFNERIGEDVIEEGNALPLFGFQVEW